jgi:hypothetical protein
MRPPAHCVSPAGQPHVPLSHAAPPGHAVPHAPQFRLSVSRFTHTVPQSVSPAAVLHVPVHTPAEQSVPGAQRLRHAPQLSGSLAVSVQAVPQSVSEPHVQAAFTHEAPVGHDLLQPPQFAESSWVSTQALLQSMREPASSLHVVAQWPLSQNAPPPSIAEHTVPQPPQLFGSLSVAVQTPPQRVPSLAQRH